MSENEWISVETLPEAMPDVNAKNLELKSETFGTVCVGTYWTDANVDAEPCFTAGRYRLSGITHWRTQASLS